MIFENPDGSGATSYWTEDYEALYLGLEKLYYEKYGPELKEYVLGELSAVCGTGKTAAKQSNAFGDQNGTAKNWEIMDCFKNAAWIQLPGGPREMPDGAYLLISGTEGRSFKLYEEGPYLLLDEYPWMKLAGEDNMFGDVSALIQEETKPAKVESPAPTVGERTREVLAWIEKILASPNGGASLLSVGVEEYPNAPVEQFGREDGGAHSGAFPERRYRT